MSLRQKFEGVGCKRFGDNKESTAAVDRLKKRDTKGASASIDEDALADLRAENKALRQKIASQALEIKELQQRGAKQTIEKLRNMSEETKTPRQGGQKPASSKGGRPRLPDDERERRRKAQKAAARKPKS